MHVVLAGNPGVGKSAILNSLVGSVKFRSGISYGSGMTTVLQTVEKGGVKYSDTPGLADTERKEMAAREISKAFQDGGDFKLIFVVLTDAGRVRPSDLATINIILQAIEEVGISTKCKYSIIVNQCGPKMLSGLREKTNRAKIELPFGVGQKVKHIGYMPLVKEAIQEEDYLLSNRLSNIYVSFVNEAPYFHLRRNNGLQVKADGYKNTAEALANQLKELYDVLEEAQKRKKDPVFWMKVVIKMYDKDTSLKSMMDLFNEFGSTAPVIMKFKESFSH